MKIGLVILHADPLRGGAERYTVDLATALNARGHRSVLIASSFGEGVKRPEDVLLRGRRTRVGRYLGVLGELNRHLESNHYDIVHAMLPVRRCDVYHPHAGIAADAIASGHLKHDGPIRQMLAHTANQFNRRRQKFAAIERELLTSPNPPVVFCLSEYVKRIVCKHYPLSDDKTPMLFNAVDLARFDPGARPAAGDEIRRRFNIDHGKVVALMIAQDFARKGLREAIGALAQVKDPNLILLVVGKENANPYRNLAGQHGLGKRVVFAGPTDDPYSFYRAADFFILPTRHDPCSLVVLEALAMGLPVISTVFNGACDIMTDGEHGFVLKDPTDVAALSNAMQKLVDPRTRDTMAKACTQLRPRLSYERHLDELLRIYELARVPSERNQR